MKDADQAFPDNPAPPAQKDDLMAFLREKEEQRSQRLTALTARWKTLKTGMDLPALRDFTDEVLAGLQLDIMMQDIVKGAVNHLRTDVFISKIKDRQAGSPQISSIIDSFMDKASARSKMEKIRSLVHRLDRLQALPDKDLRGNDRDVGRLQDLRQAIGEGLHAMDYMPDHMYTDTLQNMLDEIGFIEDQVSLKTVLQTIPETQRPAALPAPKT